MEEVNKANEVKITSVEKAKDPKSVEAGKKLGAMSKQAKEKKAASQKIDIEEFQIPSIDSIDPLIVVGFVGVVGVVLYYKYFSKKNVDDNKSDNPTPQEVSTPEPQEKPKQERRELDTLD